MKLQIPWAESLIHQLYSQPVLSTLITALVSIIIIQIIVNFINKRGQPPGPIGLPIVGYFPFLPSKEVHKELHKMGQRYGPIFRFKMGYYNIVVINNYDAIKESGRLDAFSDKAPKFFQWSDTNQHLADMNGAPWKEQRKFMSTTLRNIGMSHLKVEDSIKEEISLVLERLKTLAGGADINIRDVLSPAVNNIIMSLICGKTWDSQHQIMQLFNKFQHNLFQYFQLLRLPFFFPTYLRLYKKFSSKLAKLEKELLEFQEFISEEIKEHRELYQADDKKDYIDHFLEEIDNQTKGNGKTSFTAPSLLGNAGIMLSAGSDTIRSTVEWTMLCVARHQLTQEMIHKHIIDVLGPNTKPEWKDRERLPLIQALILEVMRYKILAPIPGAHWTSDDSVVGGFKIPKETMVWLNLWSVHNDVDHWGDPENFRPERFLSNDLKSIVNAERVVPFGIGKRNCPGDKLAEVEVFLFVTSLVQKFRILPPSTGVCMDEVAVLTQMVVNPMIRVQPR